MHATGVPLIDHVEAVLAILEPFHPDAEMTAACALQHMLSEQIFTLHELEEHFGPTVCRLVSHLHLLSRVTSQGRRVSIEDLRLMLVSMSDDARLLPLVLADRIFVLELAQKLPVQERRRVARDVLGLFAPVAARLGIHSLKQRLERLAFPVVYPTDAEHIQGQLSLVQRRYGDFVYAIAKDLEKTLEAQGIRSSVDSRQKQPYSIFSKMRSKGFSDVTQLNDLFALRIVVSTEAECYQALGLLHRLGRPASNRFKDYIAFPKPNGYRSLHTTLARFPGVPEGVNIEAQIRTSAMHREAELGIAAHWSYKEGGLADKAIQRVRVQQALTNQYLTSPDEKASVLADHIFVLTPKGDVIELPEGATPLDFAFQVHTNVGLSFRSARVNGEIVPISTELENGDMVEVLTHRTPNPSAEWLQHLKLSSARSRLKHFLASQDRDGSITKGKELLNVELETRHLPPLDRDYSLLKVVDGTHLTVTEREDLLVKLAQGSDKVGSLLRRVDALRASPSSRKIVTTAPPRMQRKDSVIQTDFGLPVPIRYAKCCKPQEQRHLPIIGIVNRTGEVVVHRESCRMLKGANPARKIHTWWK